VSVIRVLLVDDHEMVRAGLHGLLSRSADLEIVGEAATAAGAVDAALRLQPDIVLMDMRLPDGSGVDACREILSALPATRVIFLTSYAEELAHVSTVLGGAAGYLLKDIAHEQLVEAIRAAAAGRPVNEPEATRLVAQRLRHAPTLSKQEYRVLALVVDGKTNREIGAQLGLSEKTVRNYLSNAFQKLGVSRRSQAAAMFVRDGLGKEEQR
jgi:two-component system, NarL family, response regulator DevR